jgi:hypothetical protein
VIERAREKTISPTGRKRIENTGVTALKKVPFLKSSRDSTPGRSKRNLGEEGAIGTINTE